MPADQSKYISNWKYFEIAKYVKSLDRVIRVKNNDRPVLITDAELNNFITQNNNTGLYTSIWRYNETNLDSATRLASLYFDIDNKDQEQSLKDCIKLYDYLSNFIAESIKSKLNIESLDFSVYDARRMWRLAGSVHQDTGLYKNIISEQMLKTGLSAIMEYCLSPADNLIEEQCFSAKANEWFRSFTYELEIHKEKSKDFIGYFNKYGSSAFKSFQESEKEFTPKNLVENCTAVKRLWQQAIEKKYLEHEARLFLCSILTYSDESIKFLHGILSNCDDYNVEKTNSHVNDWIKRRQLGIGGRPYTCERANAVGVGCGECSLEKRNKWIKVGDKYIETQDQSSPSPIRFAYKNTKKGGE